jgi:hypothetical protein
MSTTPFNAAQVIIPKQQDNSITAAVAMITINQILIRIRGTSRRELIQLNTPLM